MKTNYVINILYKEIFHIFQFLFKNFVKYNKLICELNKNISVSKNVLFNL